MLFLASGETDIDLHIGEDVGDLFARFQQFLGQHGRIDAGVGGMAEVGRIGDQGVVVGGDRHQALGDALADGGRVAAGIEHDDHRLGAGARKLRLEVAEHDAGRRQVGGDADIGVDTEQVVLAAALVGRVGHAVAGIVDEDDSARRGRHLAAEIIEHLAERRMAGRRLDRKIARRRDVEAEFGQRILDFAGFLIGVGQGRQGGVVDLVDDQRQALGVVGQGGVRQAEPHQCANRQAGPQVETRRRHAVSSHLSG